MKFDKLIDIYKENLTSDGMGGFTNTNEKIGTFEAFITPVKMENQLKEFGFISKTALKVFTREKLNDSFITILIDGKFYKVIQIMNHKRITVLLVELI